MANGHSDEFRCDAVRIALTSGLTRRQVSAYLGVGLSTLPEFWISGFLRKYMLTPQTEPDRVYRRAKSLEGKS